jgi:2-hydroxy-6-oxonona-2,4-dienedioate hydrolase
MRLHVDPDGTSASGLAREWTLTAAGVMHARLGGDWSRPDRTAVVLVHGLVISSRYMVPTAVRLAPLAPVAAIDLPGYGDSAKPPTILGMSELADALAAWMDARGLRSAHWVGNSFGCQILAELAVRHPDRIRRLVLQGPTVDPRARTVLRQLVGLARNSTRESPGLGWITLTDYRKAGLRRVWATVQLAMADRIEAKLPRILAPTLVVRGEHDPIVPQAWAEAVSRLLPNGELRVLSGLGHTLNYTAPREFVAAMRPFLGL